MKVDFCCYLLYVSHTLLRDNDITGVLDHTFCVEHNAYGEIIQHELKPNGKSVPVTEDTKKEYVRYGEVRRVNTSTSSIFLYSHKCSGAVPTVNMSNSVSQ